MSRRPVTAEFKAGVRFAVTWLHSRATEMNDPHAKAILNSAAFNLGVETTRVTTRISETVSPIVASQPQKS